MKHEFTLTAYLAIIDMLRERGYEFRKFDTVEQDKKHVIMRHDVDFSPEYALTLAESEREKGVSAYYYFLVRSPFYNILTPSVARTIRQIAAQGHEIGLHFDASLHSGDRDALERAALEECEILESVAQTRFGTMSFHRPAPELVGMAGKFAGRLHSYDPHFVQDIGYCSDSRGAWRFGHPLENEAVQENRALQLLTHPVWWYQNVPDSPVERVRKFLGEKEMAFSVDAGENCIPYAQWKETRVEEQAIKRA